MGRVHTGQLPRVAVVVEVVVVVMDLVESEVEMIAFRTFLSR
jgi:hypothetical protein